jgi:hypothetical protein
MSQARSPNVKIDLAGFEFCRLSGAVDKLCDAANSATPRNKNKNNDTTFLGETDEAELMTLRA